MHAELRALSLAAATVLDEHALAVARARLILGARVRDAEVAGTAAARRAAARLTTAASYQKGKNEDGDDDPLHVREDATEGTFFGSISCVRESL